ncbi:MAG: PqqD family protein, partial [Sphingomicrobium sp.]
ETGIDDEIVIMRLDNGEFFALSGTAAAAWCLIDGKRDRDALSAELFNQFAGDPQVIASDLDDFLVRLTESGLLDCA